MRAYIVIVAISVLFTMIMNAIIEFIEVSDSIKAMTLWFPLSFTSFPYIVGEGIIILFYYLADVEFINDDDQAYSHSSIND